MNSSGVEDHTLEGAVLNVLVVVGHMNLPLSRLIRLEGGVEGAVVLRDRATQGAVGRGVGGHLQQVRSGRVVWVDQHLQQRLSTKLSSKICFLVRQDGGSTLFIGGNNVATLE